MMNLFSSFDLNFFYYIIILIMILFKLMEMSFYRMSKLMNLSFSMFFFFNNMFSNNKSKFEKMILYLFIMIFIFIFSFNFFSLMPYIFSLTTRISTVFYFSLSIWMSFMIFTLVFNFKMMFSHLIPEGSPFILSLVLFLVELMSNLIRPLTLSIRLCSNILAGHLLMILAFMIIPVFKLNFIIYLMLNLIEIFVSIIQAYIFMTLVSLYYLEMINS